MQPIASPGTLSRVIRSDWFIVGAAMALAVAGYCFTDRIPVNGGLGYDGIFYVEVARDPYHRVFVEGVDDYRIVRILPSVAVHGGLKLLGIPCTDANILDAFAVLNAGMIVISSWLWCLVANRLAFGLGGKWFGFVGLFFSFAAAKHAFYYPDLTDMPAFALGAGMLYAYLASRVWMLTTLVLLAGWTFPPAFATGLLLLVFPRRPEDSVLTNPAPARLHSAVCAACAGVIFGLSITYWIVKGPDSLMLLKKPMIPVFWLSLLIAFSYLACGIRAALNCSLLYDVRAVFARMLSWRLALAAALIAAKHGFVTAFATGPAGLTVLTLHRIVFASLILPGISLVAHAVYFGPVFFCALFLWRPICASVRACGLGLALATAFAVFLSLLSESRCSICFVPLLVPFVAQAVENLEWQPAAYWRFAGISLLYSKVWLPINLNFGPLYFSNHGAYMTESMYAIHGAITLATGLVLYRACHEPIPEQPLLPMPGSNMRVAA